MARNDALLIGPDGGVLLPAAAALADGTANPTLSKIAAYLMGRNTDGDWDTARLLGTGGGTNPGVLAATRPLDTWAITHEPAANTQATITQAAAGAGVRHVCTGFFGVVSNNSTVSPGLVRLYLRDGAAGAGTIMWSSYCNLQALLGEMTVVSITGCQIQGTAAQAMTFEFSAAGGANTIEIVSMFGYDITA